MSNFIERIQEVITEFNTSETVFLRQIDNIQKILKDSNGKLPETEGRDLWIMLRVIMGKLRWIRRDKDTFMANVKAGKWK